MLTRLIILFTLISLSVYPQDSTFTDCAGNIAPEDWLGDSFCDDNTYSWNGYLIDFNCAEFNYDGGDCSLTDDVFGCVDTLALNYIPEATIDDGSCVFPFFNSFSYGCTEIEAINFNPWATTNFNCITNTCNDDQSSVVIQVTLDQYPSETGWILTDVSNGQPIKSVSANTYNYNQAYSTISYNVCIPETGVELIVSDTYGDGMESSNWGSADGNVVMLGDAQPCGDIDTLWILDSVNFGSAAYSGVIYLDVCEEPVVFGCTDPDYVEYNPEANIDNETCFTEHTIGCTDSEAFNYDPEATLNEIIPTCNYTLIIEDEGGS